MNPLFPDQAALAATCRRWGIHRLALFGSTLKGTAHPDSDVDLLVKFEPGRVPGLLGMASIEAELSALSGGWPVDLRTAADLSRYFRDQVVREAEVRMQPEDRVRLLHMVEAAETAIQFVAGRSRADLDSDPMLRFALARVIEIIGEAAGRMSAASRAAIPDIPWALIVSMRNRLIHAYFEIDLDVLWGTTTEELPCLLPKRQATLSNNA